MDNYDIMRQAAQARFLTYDISVLAQKPGVTEEKDCLSTVFLGEKVEISKKTGICTFPNEGREADFGETLTVLDWLCDSKPDAKPAFAFCLVSSLPGVLVSGNGLKIHPATLAALIDQNPAAFRRACENLGGREEPIADIGFRLNAFPNLPLQLKFYFSDEDFPPTLTLLWDKNTLAFIRYETVYYLAACLLKKLSILVGPHS